MWEGSGGFRAVELLNFGMISGAMQAAGTPVRTQNDVVPNSKPQANALKCLSCQTALDRDSVKRCARCQNATYCSRDCQKADWKRHKYSECVAVKKQDDD